MVFFRKKFYCQDKENDCNYIGQNSDTYRRKRAPRLQPSNPAPAHGGEDCQGSSNESGDCNANPCPGIIKAHSYHLKINSNVLVDGGWSVWGSWTSCSKTCGTGTRSRTRTCDNPAPAHGGEDCQGSDYDTGDCNTTPCQGIMPFFFHCML